MNGELTVSAASKDTLPTVFGYIGIGLAFGIVGKASGLSPLLVTLMSIITYAGSAQFVIVSMLVTHSPILSIIFSVFLVNSRMILMSTTLSPYFKHESMLKNILVGSLLT
ncbi:branched-chain amino acid ABC transporter permease, partial [Lactobacillus parabuchneri]|nr:branched-chain amino acid ABC transporter permease [Lentilactobacillus parabuchneri]